MTAELSAILILLPFGSALCCYLIRSARLRAGIVLATGGLLIAAAVLLIPLTPLTLSVENLSGVRLQHLVQAADFLLLFLILFFGIKHRRVIITILALFQILCVAYLEFFLVKRLPWSISFISRGAHTVDAAIKTMTVDGISPDEPNYPYYQTFSFVTKGDPSSPARTLIDFAFSARGQAIMRKNGMAPLSR